MKANESPADRGFRIILGIVALAVSYFWLGLMDAEILGIAIAAVGVIMLVTGLTGFCPCYKLCGMSTAKKQCCSDSCGCSTNEPSE